MIRNLFKFVGLRHLKGKPFRTVLTALGIALGVALYIAILTINKSTLESFRESIEAVAGKAAIVVTGGQTGFAEEKISAVEKTGNVKYAVPLVETTAYFAGQKSSETLVILGVDLLKEKSVRVYKTTDEEVMEDPLVFLNQPDSIILTSEFAKLHNLKIDDQFSLATAAGKKLMTVRGLLTPEGPAKAYGGALAIMDIDAARLMFGKQDKLDRIDVVLKDDSLTQSTIQELEKSLGPGFVAQRPQGQSESMGRMIESYQTLLQIFSSLALLVALFLVTHSVSISVAERKKEIGTLRALGATKSGIVFLFLSEAVFLGLVGSVVGVGLGRILASGLLDTVSHSLSAQYLTTIKASKLIFGRDEVVRGLLIGTLSSFVAAVWPSWKTSSIQPLEAMKKMGTTSEGGLRRFGPMIFGGLCFSYLLVSSIQLWGSYSFYIDMLNHLAAILGSVIWGPLIVSGLIKLYRWVVDALGLTVFRFAPDNLLRTPKKTASNVLSLMIGLILVILIATLNSSFKTTIVGWFDRILHADLLVSSHGQLVSYQVQPIEESIGRELEKVPGVLMGPERGAYGLKFIHFYYEGKQLGLKAYDEPHPDTHYSSYDVQDRKPQEAGHELFHSKEPAVFVSENFVMHFKKKTGDVVFVDTPTGQAKLKIVGVIVDFASPEGVLYISREHYKRLWNDTLVDGFALNVAPGYSAKDVRLKIDQQFGQSRNLTTISNAELKSEVSRKIDQGFAYTKAFETVALLVALLGLMNTFLISVMERTREIGLFRAVGMSRKQMQSMILHEALIQGGFGALVAVALGSWIAYLWVSTSLSSVLGWIVDYSFPWAAVVTTVGLGILVAVIAGFYPAWRAAHVEIREALEYE